MEVAASAVLGKVKELVDSPFVVIQNKKKCHALHQRIKDIIPELGVLVEEDYHFSKDKAQRFYQFLEDIFAFFGQFKEKKFMRKMWSAQDDEKEFLRWDRLLTEQMTHLQLGVTIDALKKQDEISSRQELSVSHLADLKESVAMMQAEVAGGAHNAHELETTMRGYNEQIASLNATIQAQQERQEAAIQHVLNQTKVMGPVDTEERMAAALDKYFNEKRGHAEEVAGLLQCPVDEVVPQFNAAALQSQLDSVVDLVKSLKRARQKTVTTMRQDMAATRKSSRAPRRRLDMQQEIAPEEIEYGELINVGQFGAVYRAKWRNLDVAAKKILFAKDDGMSDEAHEEAFNELKAEIQVHQSLNYMHIVRLWGACVPDSNSAAIVLELADHGSLFDLIHSQDANRRMAGSLQASGLAVDIVADYVLQIFNGMQYLHDQGIFHRDLKSLNILRFNGGRNGTLKLCDFGLALVKKLPRKEAMDALRTQALSTVGKSNTGDDQDAAVGSLRWMAPELFRNMNAEHDTLAQKVHVRWDKCDAYAFGVILYELVVQKIPWEGYLDYYIRDKVMGGARLEIPAALRFSPAYGQILVPIVDQCWHADPANRPAFNRDLGVKLSMFREGAAATSGLGSMGSSGSLSNMSGLTSDASAFGSMVSCGPHFLLRQVLLEAISKEKFVEEYLTALALHGGGSDSVRALKGVSAAQLVADFGIRRVHAAKIEAGVAKAVLPAANFGGSIAVLLQSIEIYKDGDEIADCIEDINGAESAEELADGSTEDDWEQIRAVPQFEDRPMDFTILKREVDQYVAKAGGGNGCGLEETETDAVADVAFVVKPETRPEPEPERGTESAPEPEQEPEAEAESAQEPEPEAESAQEPEPEAESAQEPEPEAESAQEPEPEAESAQEPEPEAESAPELEPEPEQPFVTVFPTTTDDLRAYVIARLSLRGYHKLCYYYGRVWYQCHCVYRACVACALAKDCVAAYRVRGECPSKILPPLPKRRAKFPRARHTISGSEPFRSRQSVGDFEQPYYPVWCGGVDAQPVMVVRMATAAVCGQLHTVEWLSRFVAAHSATSLPFMHSVRTACLHSEVSADEDCWTQVAAMLRTRGFDLVDSSLLRDLCPDSSSVADVYWALCEGQWRAWCRMGLVQGRLGALPQGVPPLRWSPQLPQPKILKRPAHGQIDLREPGYEDTEFCMPFAAPPPCLVTCPVRLTVKGDTPRKLLVVNAPYVDDRGVAVTQPAQVRALMTKSIEKSKLEFQDYFDRECEPIPGAPELEKRLECFIVRPRMPESNATVVNFEGRELPEDVSAWYDDLTGPLNRMLGVACTRKPRAGSNGEAKITWWGGQSFPKRFVAKDCSTAKFFKALVSIIENLFECKLGKLKASAACEWINATVGVPLSVGSVADTHDEVSRAAAVLALASHYEAYRLGQLPSPVENVPNPVWADQLRQHSPIKTRMTIMHHLWYEGFSYDVEPYPWLIEHTCEWQTDTLDAGDLLHYRETEPTPAKITRLPPHLRGKADSKLKWLAERLDWNSRGEKTCLASITTGLWNFVRAARESAEELAAAAGDGQGPVGPLSLDAVQMLVSAQAEGCTLVDALPELVSPAVFVAAWRGLAVNLGVSTVATVNARLSRAVSQPFVDRLVAQFTDAGGLVSVSLLRQAFKVAFRPDSLVGGEMVSPGKWSAASFGDYYHHPRGAILQARCEERIARHWPNHAVSQVRGILSQHYRNFVYAKQFSCSLFNEGSDDCFSVSYLTGSKDSSIPPSFGVSNRDLRNQLSDIYKLVG